jgi:hypothetical protein
MEEGRRIKARVDSSCEVEETTRSQEVETTKALMGNPWDAEVLEVIPWIPDMNGHVFECYDKRGDQTQFPRHLRHYENMRPRNWDTPKTCSCCFRRKRPDHI